MKRVAFHENTKKTEPFFRDFRRVRRYPGVAVFSKARMTVSLEIAISDFGLGIFRPSGRPGSAAGGTHGVHASLEGSISSKCEITKRMNQLFAICEKHPPEKR